MSRWKDENWTSTSVHIPGESVSVVFHHKDLSNLGEPYLSAVKAVLKRGANVGANAPIGRQTDLQKPTLTDKNR